MTKEATSPQMPCRFGTSEERARRERRFAHAQRCRRLQPLAPGEAEAQQAAYLARVGAATECPPAYLLPTSRV